MISGTVSKDIIKSGGEWISTVELENIAIGHPSMPMPRSSRRATRNGMSARFCLRWHRVTSVRRICWRSTTAKVASWQVPDKVIFVDELPLGATGKVIKVKLRDTYGDVLWED